MRAGTRNYVYKTRALAAARPNRVAMVLGLLLLAALAAPVHAQMINPFGTYKGPTLSPSDYKAAGPVVRDLLDEKPATVGSHASWNNPASGNSGKFTIMSLFTSEGMPCRAVRADVSYARAAHLQPRSFTLDACQVADGKWKVKS